MNAFTTLRTRTSSEHRGHPVRRAWTASGSDRRHRLAVGHDAVGRSAPTYVALVGRWP